MESNEKRSRKPETGRDIVRRERLKGIGTGFIDGVRSMNLPNKLTCIRMILILPFVLFMLIGKCEGVSKWFALAIFCIASVTDTLDGYIARKNHLITDFGKFMDPLADKILVVSAMICLVSLGRMPAWMLIVIVAREFAISGFRLIASDNGIVIAAGMWGKIKTVVQMIAVILLIIDPKVKFLAVLTKVVLWAAVLLTIISLVDYIWNNREVLKMQK